MKIKDLPKIERPREKLEKYGPEKLSNSELLAILLRTGGKGLNVVEMSRKILGKFGGDGLSKAGVNDLKNTSAEKIYSRILEDNKGKVIYLDCWETACSPCRAEMPYSKKLMAKFDTAQVAFVYVCFYSDEDKWKGLLSEWQLGGQQYLADRNQSKYLSKAFSISGFPHYMLIDTKGNIVETGLRPSYDDTYSKIKGLIAK